MVREFICREDIFCSDKHEEIIRCRDCSFAGWNFLEDETKDDCFKHMTQDGFMLKIKPTDFCAWAERVD